MEFSSIVVKCYLEKLALIVIVVRCDKLCEIIAQFAVFQRFPPAETQTHCERVAFDTSRRSKGLLIAFHCLLLLPLLRPVTSHWVYSGRIIEGPGFAAVTSS